MLKILKKCFQVMRGRDFFCATDIKMNMLKLGTNYGGWWIIPNLIDGHSVVMSFGLGDDISFDMELIRTYGCKVHGFDPTPKSIAYVNKMNMGGQFVLHEVALAISDGTVNFGLPSNTDHISGSLKFVNSQEIIQVSVKKLSTIMQELGVNKIDVLKMDIEGVEHDVIKDMLKCKIYPKQLLVEFHHFDRSHLIADSKNSIKLLRDNGYALFAIDDYNYSFVRV